eukprot:m.39027 g.39027  ORF g.39027 m.39027 type:complete len:102 (-) comp10078_c0_seq2:95-400(-)
MAAQMAGVEACSGLTAQIVGKPSAWLAATIATRHALDPATTCVVGDRLDSDIRLGQAMQANTLLVLTGCTTQAEAAAAPPGAQPTFILPHVGLLSETDSKL